MSFRAREQSRGAFECAPLLLGGGRGVSDQRSTRTRYIHSSTRDAAETQRRTLATCSRHTAAAGSSQDQVQSQAIDAPSGKYRIVYIYVDEIFPDSTVSRFVGPPCSGETLLGKFVSPQAVCCLILLVKVHRNTYPTVPEFKDYFLYADMIAVETVIFNLDPIAGHHSKHK